MEVLQMAYGRLTERYYRSRRQVSYGLFSCRWMVNISPGLHTMDASRSGIYSKTTSRSESTTRKAASV